MVVLKSDEKTFGNQDIAVSKARTRKLHVPLVLDRDCKNCLSLITITSEIYLESSLNIMP